MSYITYDEYKELKGSVLTEVTAEKYLELASYDIDNVTYNRIKKIGFENLTEFQKKTIKTATVLQADFWFNNEDWLNSAISSYSINGVSVKYGESKSVNVVNDVFMPNIVYNLLKQTGLCSAILR
jgi:hypothetical protein